MKSGQLGSLMFYFGLAIVVLSLAMIALGATIIGLLFMFWGLITGPQSSRKHMSMILLAILFILLLLWALSILKWVID